jgi:hypothetical protein
MTSTTSGWTRSPGVVPAVLVCRGAERITREQADDVDPAGGQHDLITSSREALEELSAWLR